MTTSLDMPIAATTTDLPAVERIAAEEVREPSPRWPKSWPLKLWYGLCYSLEWLFGLASLLACLAVLAAIPIINFITLGYLLEASGRVARSGRLSHGFIDIPKFARIGSMIAGT